MENREQVLFNRVHGKEEEGEEDYVIRGQERQREGEGKSGQKRSSFFQSSSET